MSVLILLISSTILPGYQLLHNKNIYLKNLEAKQLTFINYN